MTNGFIIKNSFASEYRSQRIEPLAPAMKRPQAVRWPDPATIEGISDHQKLELSKALTGRIGLLGGGPGVGKSHTIVRLLKTILQKHPYAAIRMIAPTGKAAQRMTELAVVAKLNNINGTTIHTALVPQRNGHDGKGWGFFHGENNPIHAHVIVCDESSMLDAQITRSLLSAIDEGTLVLFVGDPNQLPPVGKGRPYADMIEAGLPYGHLTEIHRFAGRIAMVCKQIVDGERWTPSEKLDLENAAFPENLRHVECSDANRISKLKQILQQLQENRGFDLWEDVQVLCATNDLRKNLNEVLQASLNPNGETIPGSLYRMRDKVICTRNQWVDQDWDERRRPVDNPKHYIANGEVGVVSNIDKTFVVVDVDSGGSRKTLRFPKAAWSDVELAYAITTWKAQGSQYRAVIAVAEDHRGADMICDRSFWTTSYSRGGTISFSLGRRSAIDRQCARFGLEQRKTLLVEKIRKWLSPEEQQQEIDQETEVVTDDFSDV